MTSIIEDMTDAALFGPWFRGNTWRAWIAFLAALFGLPMSEEQASIFHTHPARSRLPQKISSAPSRIALVSKTAYQAADEFTFRMKGDLQWLRFL